MYTTRHGEWADPEEIEAMQSPLEQELKMNKTKHKDHPTVSKVVERTRLVVSRPKDRETGPQSSIPRIITVIALDQIQAMPGHRIAAACHP